MTPAIPDARLVEMLHDASGPRWSQTCYLPAGGAALEQADLALSVLGRFSSRGGFAYSQVPKQVSLHLVHAGEGTMEANGRTWEVRPGSVFTFVPGVEIHYRDQRARPWRYTWCILIGHKALAIAQDLGGQPGPWVRSDLPIGPAVSILDSIEAAFRSEDHSPVFPYSAAWRLVDALSPRSPDGERTADLAIAIRRILDQQFALPLKLGSLAHQLRVDRSTVFRRFQLLYGCSPKTYLDRLRLDHAVTLLRGEGISIAEVARRCGHASGARFAKAFRQRFGVARTRFRRHGMQ